MRRAFARVLIVLLLLLLASEGAFALSVSGWGEQVRGEGRDGKLDGKGFSVPRGKVGTIVSVECNGDGIWIEGDAYQEFTPATSAIGFQLVPGNYKVFPTLRPGQKKARANITVELSDASASGPSTPTPGASPPAPVIALAGKWRMSGRQTDIPRSDWEADLILYPDGTLSWNETKGANVGATRNGTWLFNGDRFTMSYVAPISGRVQWASRTVARSSMSGNYGTEEWSGTWSAKKVSEPETGIPVQPPAGSVSGWGEQVRGEGRDGKLNGKGFSVPRGKVGTITSVECDGGGFWIEGNVYQEFTPATSAIGFQLPPGDYKVFPNLRPGQNKAGVTVTVALSASAAPVSPSPTPTPGPSLDPKKELAGRLVQEGAELQKAGKYVEAIGKYRESLKIRPDKRIEEHVKKLEEYVKKLEEQRADPIDALLGNWVFGRNKTDFIGVVILTKEKGKFGYVIRGYYHPNESFWKFDGKQIVFIHRDGSPTTYFDRRTADYWEGQFLPDASIIHYLQR